MRSTHRRRRHKYRQRTRKRTAGGTNTPPRHVVEEIGMPASLLPDAPAPGEFDDLDEWLADAGLSGPDLPPGSPIHTAPEVLEDLGDEELASLLKDLDDDKAPKPRLVCEKKHCFKKRGHDGRCSERAEMTEEARREFWRTRMEARRAKAKESICRTPHCRKNLGHSGDHSDQTQLRKAAHLCGTPDCRRMLGHDGAHSAPRDKNPTRTDRCDTPGCRRRPGHDGDHSAPRDKNRARTLRRQTNTQRGSDWARGDPEARKTHMQATLRRRDAAEALDPSLKEERLRKKREGSRSIRAEERRGYVRSIGVGTDLAITGKKLRLATPAS